MMRNFLIGTAALLLALVAAGCSRSPRVNFYTLALGANVEAAAGDRAAPSVLVGPVTLPEVVDRPQLVVRVAANRVEVLESQRWAEPLKSELPRLMARNLGLQLGSDRVASYQQNVGAEAEYRVLLDVLRFESVPGESVTVEAAWKIRRHAGGAARTGRSLVRERVEGPGYDALVAACSRAFAGVSRDLAQGIRAEQAAAPPIAPLPNGEGK